MSIVSARLTDGFHLVVDALKANDIDTIYGVVGIPITDLARVAQAAGLTREQAVRVYSFETGGNGNHDMQAGLEFSRRARANSSPACMS